MFQDNMKAKVKLDIVNNAKSYTVSLPTVTYNDAVYTDDELKQRLLNLKKDLSTKQNEIELIEAEIEAITNALR